MTPPPFRLIDSAPPGQRLLVRVDLNSPIRHGQVQDNRRFERHAETIQALAEAEHAVIVLAHQGRPGGDDFVSLEQHAPILSSHVDRPVSFCAETHGPAALSDIEALESGDILLLENVRMARDELIERSPAEHANCSYVQSLVSVADGYVGDAYSAAHRSHASIVGLPLAVDTAYAGRVMAAEYLANSAIQSQTFDGNVTMVLGGTKADDLVRVMHGVSDTVDDFLLGGVIGELCLRATGYDLGYDVDGSTLFDDLWEKDEETIRSLLDSFEERIHLPTDLAYVDDDGNRAERSVGDIEKSTAYLDIGADTISSYAKIIRNSSAVFVKGAVGVFEDERFRAGTVDLLSVIADTAAFSVVGGGDTSRAIDMYDLDPTRFDHISIAGGAYVRALAGEALPGVDALRDR